MTFKELKKKGPVYPEFEYRKYEKGLLRPDGLAGIKVFEPTMKLGDKFHINYMPVRTDLCSFCAGRIKKGKQPSCVQHCLSGCLEVSERRELISAINEKGGMMFFT